MKKFLFIFLSLLILSRCSAFAENIKFVQITDAHFSADSDFTKKVLTNAVEDINKLEDVSFVVFTGDNINSPNPENLHNFVKIVKHLKVPYYIALGNHDVYKSGGLSKVRYYEILREENPFYLQRKSNYKFSKKGFVFLIVDGAKEVIPGATGYYKKNTLAWVDKMLTKNKNKQVVIFQHFPVVYPKGDEHRLKTHKTYKVEDYQQMLSKHDNVLAIMSGHFHINYEKMENGVYNISTPSLLNMPHSYKIVDIVTTPDFAPIIYTQLRDFEIKE